MKARIINNSLIIVLLAGIGGCATTVVEHLTSSVKGAFANAQLDNEAVNNEIKASMQLRGVSITESKVFAWASPWTVTESNGTAHASIYNPLHTSGQERGPVVQLSRDDAGRVFASLAYDQQSDKRAAFQITITFSDRQEAPSILKKVTFPFYVPNGCPNQANINLQPVAIENIDKQAFAAIQFARVEWDGGTRLSNCDEAIFLGTHKP